MEVYILEQEIGYGAWITLQVYNTRKLAQKKIISLRGQFR